MLDRNNFLKDQNTLHQFHPMTHPLISREHRPQIIVDSDGCYVTDIDGNRMVDGLGGLWNVNVGHNRAEVKAAIVKQMDRISYYSSFAGTATAPSIELSARVCQMGATEEVDKVMFSANGSDAVETALKLARQYWKLVGEPMRTKFISLKQGYHGVHFGGLSVNGTPYYRTVYEPLLPGCFQIDTPWTYRNPYSEDPAELTNAVITQLERTIYHEGAGTIAAFIAEPIQGAGGVIVPPADFWPRLRAVCDQHGILLIADEVVTGFGRSGSMFGSRGWGVKPDIMCLAKGITSGYVPLGATTLNKRVASAWYDGFTPEGVIMHGYTSTGHPLACAAALAVLDIVEGEDLPGNAARMGERLMAGLKPLAETCSVVGEVRGKGLMIGLDFVSDKKTRTPIDPGTGIVERIAGYAREKGAIVRPAGSVIILSPPLVIGEAEIDVIIDALTYGCARYDAETRA
ncbi:aminotransferase class III-fold pyridoxal phosphate-dependent enzyme [Pararhodobacter zhoushanensis]|uniref:Aminotransferase class III-fold pyridoxal phosphate-dependent enzyme n=1 Tax=Pararhodobacter zhoushanensis TaxID=2479545 RepID=A0ABT3GXI0_9RHOB|nr:aminotransferase class III-fold pyridoxal phosphate-dependent enzyme [Pararhodobacter zhoushanensis]MCW1932261.1 aminotransferase class III-fold pyridoxal phosphate-dependent enzyme [Pararhodobacter zhoushanensis]